MPIKSLKKWQECFYPPLDRVNIIVLCHFLVSMVICNLNYSKKKKKNDLFNAPYRSEILPENLLYSIIGAWCAVGKWHTDGKRIHFAQNSKINDLFNRILCFKFFSKILRSKTLFTKSGIHTWKSSERYYIWQNSCILETQIVI